MRWDEMGWDWMGWDGMGLAVPPTAAGTTTLTRLPSHPKAFGPTF